MGPTLRYRGGGWQNTAHVEWLGGGGSLLESRGRGCASCQGTTPFGSNGVGLLVVPAGQGLGVGGWEGGVRNVRAGVGGGGGQAGVGVVHAAVVVRLPGGTQGRGEVRVYGVVLCGCHLSSPSR